MRSSNLRMLVSSTFFSTWVMLLSSMLFFHGTMGQSTTVDISKQKNPHFMGWYIGPSTTQALMDPGTWTTSGNYARGCSRGNCAYATDCTGNFISYDDGGSSPCIVCRTMTLFQSAPYALPSATNIFCAESWSAFTVFRELAVSTTSSDSSSSTISTSLRTTTQSTTPPTITSSSTQAPSTTDTTTATQSGESQTVTGSESSQSRGWIAGAVVGSFIAVAIVAGLVGWFVYRRKKARKESVKEESVARKIIPSQRNIYKPPQAVDPSQSHR
ncbi:unnamed protein product [Penicillium olsonii]|uniref:Uncharacterized protein n=1 Tax=Penicillium olsonii TaxID=99116 RepID=A0A9W4MNM7_PENOL|nr:unnamed protein product [Penicillium olsonii]CAG8147806.1 unnamed protein product [Penicillium olsonii]